MPRARAKRISGARRRLLVRVVLLALLTACAAPGAAQSPQSATLNHLYAVVDQETADAISQSAFLRDFANLRVTTVAADQGRSWSGRYLLGRETYVEIFGPGDSLDAGAPRPPGAIGIALGGDREGSLAELRRRLDGAGRASQTVMRTRQFGTRSVDWFWSLTLDGQFAPSSPPVVIWAMEYAPAFFDAPEAQKELAEHAGDRVSRERYLADAYLEHMMRDIREADFNIAAADAPRLRPMLEAADMRVVNTAGGFVASDAAHVLRFRLVEPRKVGLARLVFSLNEAAAPRTEQIGRSRLTLGPGAVATWTFESAETVH